MSFRGVVLCSLLGLPLAIVACGGVDGEPAVADAARDTGNHVTKTDGGSPEASRAEAGRPDGSGNTHDGSADAKERDTGLDAGLARDHGEASTTYPAFTPFMPQVQYGGGPVLSNAEIVMITWYGDENASTFEAFGDDLGTSDYWAQTTSEYHVGPAHSGPENHVRLPQSEAPIANWSDTAIEAWVTTHVQSYGTYGWPAPTSNSVYVLYLPPNEDIQFSGSDACQSGIGGYHGNVIVNSKDVAYAVVLQCQDNSGAQTTAEASHELIEAATDPHPSDITAWVGFDQDHLAWDVFQSFQDEVADACEFYFDAFYEQTFSTVETLDAGPDSGEGGILARRRPGDVCDAAHLVERQRGRRSRPVQADRLLGLLQRLAAPARPVRILEPHLARGARQLARPGLPHREGRHADLPGRILERWAYVWSLDHLGGGGQPPHGARHVVGSHHQHRSDPGAER